uniref:Uncharacterized protein n=1 Tax=Timema shepardi TaxID=629360 RepID=A0A7R9G704_TIMSH|nr:unnamed protein product [Timema shepardi]
MRRIVGQEDSSTGGQECAESLNIDYTAISACSDSQEGNILLSGLGNQTHAFKPTVNHVPYVVLGGVYNSADEEQALVDLKSLVCNLLGDTKPSSCDVPSL